MGAIPDDKRIEQALNESERFAHAILNALSAHLAILDENGVILAVNRAWREFATNNTPVGTVVKTHVGVNYLSVCESASGPNAEEAEPMAKGIRAIIRGQQDEFSLEYSCHAPDEKRWFVAHVTRFTGDGPVRVVMEHENVTQYVLLEKAERDQRQLSDALRDAASALNSTLELDEVLDRILDNIGKIISNDAVMILLIEPTGIRTVRYRNKFEVAISEKDISNTQANLINAPILEEMLTTRLPYVIPDTKTDRHWRSVAGMQWIRSFISAPLEIRGRLAGAVNLASAAPGFFTQEHADRLRAFVSQAAIAIENAQLYKRSHYLANTDPLTELHNRRSFFENAVSEFDRARRYDRMFSVAIMDLDHFKSVNDTYGHDMGDLVLSEVAKRIKNSVRTVDIVARYGGEEFIVLMPETDLAEAHPVAERVRRSVVDSLVGNKTAEILVTLSIGVATIKANTDNLDELIKHADQALYKAKANGRNRVEIYSNGK